jgi:hypothetical protein
MPFFSKKNCLIEFSSNFFQPFVAFLEENRTRLAKLRILTLRVDKVPATMTARTVIALLRNSDLEEFNWLTALPLFTAQDQVQLLVT